MTAAFTVHRAVDGARARGLLAGFENSADLGGLPLPDGSVVPARRIVRANTPERLSPRDREAALEFGFGAVLDLRSDDAVHALRRRLGVDEPGSQETRGGSSAVEPASTTISIAPVRTS